jgi:hypothetical protein
LQVLNRDHTVIPDGIFNLRLLRCDNDRQQKQQKRNKQKRTLYDIQGLVLPYNADSYRFDIYKPVYFKRMHNFIRNQDSSALIPKLAEDE